MERYCIFDLGSRRLALPMACVRETVPLTELVPVVLAPEFVRGMFALRGELVTVIDLAQFVGPLSSGNESVSPPSGLLILERGNERFAVAVTGVSSVEVDTSQLLPHPNMALYPALDSLSSDATGPFHILQFDRLQSGLRQALGFERLLRSN